MDGYRDLYRAPYYTSPRYSLSAADPLVSAYARAPLDAYAGYAASVSYQPELLPFHRYAPSLRSLSPRRHTNPRRRPSAQTGVQGPRFKKSHKSTETSTPKKGAQRTASQKKPLQKEQKVGSLAGNPPKSLATSLAKETQELHSLYRTGVDSSTGKKLVKPSAKKADETPRKNSKPNVTGQKRKADAQKKDEAPSSAKKSRRRKYKKLAKIKQETKKDKTPVFSTPKAVKVETPVLTEEEKKEVDASLALQNAACKAVGEFLGIPEKREEPEKSEAPDASADEVKLDEAQPNPDGEAKAKLEEASKPAPLTPDEEKELEEKGYKFFSKVLEENQDLRNLYLEKKDAGTFECLVCHSIDPETSKKFSNLTNLVMHTSMRKQNRPEHRGYGHAICDVLGWESLRVPKRPAKQVKEEGDLTEQSEGEKVPDEVKPGDN